MAVDGEDFGKEISWVDKAGKENKTEKVLAGPFSNPVETHVDGLGLLRTNRGSRKSNRAFVVDEQERG